MNGDGFQGWDEPESAPRLAQEPTQPDRDPEIRDLAGVAAFFILEPDATVEQISRAAFDATECGAFVEEIRPEHYGENGPGIVVGSIVEGSVAQTTNHLLHYPFNHADLTSALDQVEEEARELWHVANCHEEGCPGEECQGCKDCECFDDDGMAPEDHPGFDPLFLTF
jgi:hypothetical protein